MMQLTPLQGVLARLSVLATTAAVLTLSAAHAETLYVTDILRLGLHQASDTSDQPFRTLVSGDELEIIQRTRYYAEVRTARGEVGWVKASYLTDEKPAQARLADLTAERDSLSQRLGELQSQLETQEQELAGLTDERERLRAEAQTANGELATLRADNQRLGERVAQFKFSVPLRWVLATALAMLGIGLLAGWLWYDWKHRQKHGGFRL